MRCGMLMIPIIYPSAYGACHPVVADEPIRFDYGPNYDYSGFSRETRTLQETFEADADDYSPAWGDVSAWVPLHVYDGRGVPSGDPVCMSPTAVVRALQLKCDPLQSLHMILQC
eukprot:COSAG05_NODE_69_length_22151_cov_124.775258_17_plen_114_part_00